MDTSDFFYELPDSAIAQQAIEPRDAARLLDTRSMNDHRFRDLAALLEPGDLIVVNRSRVTAARLHARKDGSGGGVEVLILGKLSDGSWQGLVRPARRVRVGTRLAVGEVLIEVVAAPEAGVTRFREVVGRVEDAIASAGIMPLPPYFAGRLDDPERYQTVYADRPGSAAAPTAGLHFTDELMARVRNRGISIAQVELRVGLDTFRPISAATVDEHTIHSEEIEVGESVAAAIAATRSRGSRVVAIGTTVVRALETAVGGDGDVAPFTGPTDLFIRPGHRFRAVDLLVTNFHVPSSTLVVLLAAFMGPRWRSVYRAALERGYRFLSFGDAMLAERGDGSW